MMNTFPFSLSRARMGVGIAIVAAGLGILTPARADIKIVALVTTKGVPPAAPGQATAALKPFQVVSYYKGDRVRVESGDPKTDGNIIITDYAANAGKGKVTTLNPKARTFTVSTIAQQIIGIAGPMPNNPMMAGIQISAKVDVHGGGKSRLISGKTTRNTVFQAVFTSSVADNPALASMLPVVTIRGEFWTTGDVALPAASLTRMQIAGAQAATIASVLPNVTGLRDFAEKMKQIKGLPLASTSSFLIAFPPGSPAIAMAGDQFPKEPIVTTTETQSLSEAPLPDSLFAPPADYRQVAAPAAPPPVPAPNTPVVSPPVTAPALPSAPTQPLPPMRLSIAEPPLP